ncbi:MAG: hypothetical protein LBG65_06985 [Puniceicoccales bacterium]|jgi:uncharacterized protein RhaS with RHS repeats|nr:hypothetical protein [Puniceicoccales bacterium]
MRSGQRATRSQSGTAFAIRSTYIFSCNLRNEVIASTNNQIIAANRAYDYDPIGNRLTATEGASNNPAHSKNYTTNTLNQYTTMTTLIFPPSCHRPPHL